MASPLDNESTNYWTELADRLRRELAATTDSSRRAQLLHALARILGDRLGSQGEANRCLAAAFEADPQSKDLLWHMWRSASRRGPEERIAALGDLSGALLEPKDTATAKLWLARLQKHYVGDDQMAKQALDEAKESLSDHRGILWTQAEFAAKSGDIKQVVSCFEQLATLSQDSVWRAALLIEIAEIKLSNDVQPDDVGTILKNALEEPAIDWSIVNSVLRMSAKIGDWQLHEEALVKMAEAALDTEPEPENEQLPGQMFQGFDRGESKAASLWWAISLNRQLNLKDNPSALRAIEKALEYLPDHPFLEIERIRMLDACGKTADALEEIPDSAPNTWKAELAMASNRPELVSSLLQEEADLDSLGYSRVLAEVAGGADESPPDITTESSTLLKWFLTHPGHPDSPGIAALLAESGINLPAVQLSILENSKQETRLSDLDNNDETESWPLAVEAVRSSKETSPKSRAQAYLNWAEQTSDLTLKSAFVWISARFTEQDNSASETALDLYKRALKLAPDQTDTGTNVFRLMHSLGKWDQLSELLADTAAVTKDDFDARVSLHERAIVLEQGLDSPAQAAETVADLLARDNDDISAIWSQIRLAFRLGDWPLVLREIEHLMTLCHEDVPLFNLLLGEFNLFIIGNLDEALQRFEHAASADNEAIAQTARLYRFYVLYQLGDLEELDQALRKESNDTENEDLKAFWLPELLETGRAVHGTIGVTDLLEHTEELSPSRIIWQMMVEMDMTGPNGVRQSLVNLAQVAPKGEIASACRIAANLLNTENSENDRQFDETDLESPEALFYAADRIVSSDSATLQVEIYKKRAKMAEGEDNLEWVEWMLLRAEAEERTGEKGTAYQTICEALERSPEHPGLLETQADLAFKTGRYEDCADAHGRLAGFFASEEEKAYHLTQNAKILFEKLKNDKSAERICMEALKLEPGHPEAKDLLVWINKSRGDEENVARLLEEQIDIEHDTEKLIALYEEQSDQFFAMDDPEGALSAIDSLLTLAPDRISAYLTKIEILAELERWKEVIAAIRDYCNAIDDPVAVRTMSWRAADLIAEQIGDTDAAIAWLEQLVSSGDRHPDTEQKLLVLAQKAENWEVAANSLSRLASLQDSTEAQIPFKLDEAKIRLEKLFDDKGANEIIDSLLEADPANHPTLEFSLQFSEKDKFDQYFERALKKTRDELHANPTDLALLNALNSLAKLKDIKDLVLLTEDLILLLSGVDPEPWPGDLIPASDLDSEMLRYFFVHPGEINTATRIAEMTGKISGDVFSDGTHLPKIHRKTRINPKDNDPVANWTEAWAKLLGYGTVEIHRINNASRDAVALPGELPGLAVSSSVASPLTARHRFFLARNLWRSARGLGAFEEGDASTPAKWVVALSAVVVGDRIELPLPTEKGFVTRVKKAMPRRLKRGLQEPSNLILKENRQSLRAWAQAISFSADRFGLLAATRLTKVVPLIVEETTGKEGLKKFRANPEATLLKIPRCLELIRFAISKRYLDARRQVGLKVLPQGDKR